MIFLIYIGITSFSLSFTISNFITREILRNRYEVEIYEKKDKKLDIKNLSKVKFNKEIKVRYIPSRQILSPKTLSELWYNQNDFNTFKNNYKFETKYNSI